ncbi:MAG: hypothetical protein Q8P41_15300 [Pseudomonadota bacterium]|nr:hypothetical protein [Pseudomonadota bacterium]
MSTWTTFRLAAWREFWGRWPVHAVAPVLAGIGLLLPMKASEYWANFVVVGVLPPLVGIVASRGRVAADPFWTGLGGPGWARLAGAVTVHLPPLVAAAVVLGVEESAGLLLVVYTSVLAARSLRGGLLLVFAPFLAAPFAMGSAAFSSFVLLNDVNHSCWWGVWFVLTGILAAGVAFRWEQHGEGGRMGPSLGRRRLGTVGVGILAVSTAAVPLSRVLPCRSPSGYQDLSDSGAVLLVPVGEHSIGRAEVWMDGTRRVVGPRGADRGSIGPGGAVVLEVFDEQVFVTPEGAVLRCEAPPEGLSIRSRWRADGTTVLLLTPDGLHTVGVDGCRAEAAEDGAWLGNQLVLVAGDAVLIDGAEMARPGKTQAIEQSQGHVYLIAGGALQEVTSGGLVTIAAVSGDRLQSVPHGVCVRETASERCWWNGTHASVEHPVGDRTVDVDLAVDGRRLYEPSTGHTRATVDSVVGITSTVLPDGTARFLSQDHVRDISPTGVVTERYF